MKGTTWRPVSCEKCMHEFTYEMQITATGQGSSPYFLNNSGAQASAQERAKASFDDKIKNSFATVPCPICGHIQSSMVERDKQQWKAKTIGTFISTILVGMAFVSGELGVVLAVLVWLIATMARVLGKNKIAGVIMWAMIALSIVAFAIYSFKPDLMLAITVMAGLITTTFFGWKAFYYDMNADLDKNKQKSQKYRTLLIKRKVDKLDNPSATSGTKTQ